MRDGEISTDATLTPADRAVKYLLDRAQRDANLRHYLLHTEAMRLLCAAEALRLGREADDVERERGRWLGEGGGRADAPRYRSLLEENGIDC